MDIYRKVTLIPYKREKAVEYAHRWALGRNPAYLDFEKLGGDCTNFASQCIFAGSGVMNYTPTFGWYYENSNRRTASWTGVNYFFDFITGNQGHGPYAEQVDVKDVQPGDVVQLSFQGGGVYNHTPVIVQTGLLPCPENILIAAHTFDRDHYMLANYQWKDIRYLHIVGVRI